MSCLTNISLITSTNLPLNMKPPWSLLHSAWSLGWLSPFLGWIKVTYLHWGCLSFFSAWPELYLTASTYTSLWWHSDMCREHSSFLWTCFSPGSQSVRCMGLILVLRWGHCSSTDGLSMTLPLGVSATPPTPPVHRILFYHLPFLTLPYTSPL